MKILVGVGADERIAFGDERRHGGDASGPRLIVLSLYQVSIATIAERRAEIVRIQA